MDYSDHDVKKYDPSKKKNQLNNMLNKSQLTSDMSDNNKDKRRREENYIFRGYGTMMDTSETIDFSDGTDSDTDTKF